jgi:hypothetical protein
MEARPKGRAFSFGFFDVEAPDMAIVALAPQSREKRPQ